MIKLHIQDMGADKVLFVKKQSYMNQEYLDNLFKRMHESNIADEIFFNTDSEVTIDNDKGIYVVLMFQNISVASRQLFELFKDIDKEYQKNIKNSITNDKKDVFVSIGDRNIKMINVDEFLKSLALEQPKKPEAPLQQNNLLTPFFQKIVYDKKENSMPKFIPKGATDLPNYLSEFNICPNITEHIVKKMVMDCYTEYIHIMMSLECPPEDIDIFDDGSALKYLQAQGTQLKEKIHDLLAFIDILGPLKKNCDDCSEC